MGGAERSAFELAAALQKCGLEAHIVAAKGKTSANKIHILCQNRPGKRTYYFTFLEAVSKHFAENHYDIIHSFLPFGFADVYQPRGGSFAESIVRNAASYQNRFFESYKRMTAFANFRRGLLLRAERRLCKDSNGPFIAAISQYVAGQFKQHYGLADERIVVIPNGIDTHKQVDTAEAQKLRVRILTQLGIKEADSAVLYLFAANNFRLKGLAPLIRAMRLVAENGTERGPYLIVAGNDRPHKYHRIAEELNVRKRIFFLGR